MRWRFFSKPAGLDLESWSVAGAGNNWFLLSFFIFFELDYCLESCKNVCFAGNRKQNAIAFTRAAASRNKGVVARARWHRKKCVQQLRGTRKVGGVFDAVGKARAIYWVKIEEYCVVCFGYWLLFFSWWFDCKVIINCFEFSKVPKTRNDERNTLLLCAFVICDNPLYYLEFGCWLICSKVTYLLNLNNYLQPVISYAKWLFSKTVTTWSARSDQAGEPNYVIAVCP